MKTVADLHLHSKYSRAVSQDMVTKNQVVWANRKGIDLLSAADFTHPFWFEELKKNLVDQGNGFYRDVSDTDKTGPQFLLSTEVSSIYSHLGKVRRIHLLLFAPSLSAAEKITTGLSRRGANLMADGRPILGLSAHDVATIVYEADPLAFIIPAHIWTPWFSLYGANSGYDTMTDCFGDLTDKIPAVETGLSSDPAMNWRIEELDGKSIVSFSDAHSLSKLAREATVFEDVNDFESLLDALKTQRIAETIEFYPEEGKYHFTGHRDCNVKQTPEETKKLGETCPVCGKKLTVGVMHRVEDLATRPADYRTSSRPGYRMLVPLIEIVAEVIGQRPESKKVVDEYNRLTDHFGNELTILLDAPLVDIQKFGGERLSEAVDRVRAGNIVIDPGYDGVFGKVSIWNEKDAAEDNSDQMPLF